MLHRAFAALWHTARRVRITWHIVSALALEIGLAAPLSACGGGPPAAVTPTHMSTAISISATPTLESGHIDEFNVLPGSPDTFLFGIAKGSDGNLWVTYSKQVGVPVAGIARVTPAGVVTKFQVANPASEPVAITPGPDGALWFTETGISKIGRITSTGVITEYALVSAQSRPVGIAAGPDGALWFTETGISKIGRITTAGAITEFRLDSPGSAVFGITVGPDGALWFAQSWGCTIESPCGKVAIGRITTAGVVTEFPSAVIRGYTPNSIAAGSDGNLWFTEESNTGQGSIGRITPSGNLTTFTIPTQHCSPHGITPGPDGALWFTEDVGNKIGRITTTGKVTEFTVRAPGSRPTAIVTGPDGGIWFSESAAGNVGRLTP